METQTLSAPMSWLARAGLLWVASGIVMVLVVGRPAVRRTQEARVLESAREMLGRPWRDWVIPKLDGQVRLQKPPLAYWLSAGGYSAFGVSEWAGRLAPLLAGWLTLAVTFVTCAWLFGRRAAFFAGAALASCLMFCRHFALAETDAATALFVTMAIALLWYGCGIDSSASTERRLPSPGGQFACFHLASLAIGLAALCKGPPALFPVLFLVALALIERRASLIWRWVRSGAPLTAVLIAAPWYLYIALAPESRVIRKEIDVVLGGTDHPGWFFAYFPQLLYGVAPWSLPVALAVVESITRWRRDPRLRGLLLWCAAVFLPLCVAGNKQPHYLLPLLPPLMILTGWLIDQAWEGAGSGIGRRAVQCVGLTIVASALAVAALVVVAPWVQLHRVRLLDTSIAAAALAAGAAAVFIFRRRGLLAAASVYAVACVLAAPLVVVYWTSTLYPGDSRRIAGALHARFGAGPYCFLGEGAYLPLCFAMRTEIPYVKTAPELEARGTREAGLVVLVQADPRARSGKPVPPLPAHFVKVTSVGEGEELLDVYRQTDVPVGEAGLP